MSNIRSTIESYFSKAKVSAIENKELIIAFSVGAITATVVSGIYGIIRNVSPTKNKPSLIRYNVKSTGRNIWGVNEAEIAFLCDQIYADKEYDTDQISFDNLDENSLIIDIGSNIGLFSQYVSDKTNKKANIIAIEPVPELIECTNKNLIDIDHQRNKYELYQVAIGDTSKLSKNDDRIISFKYYPLYSLLSGIADNCHNLTFNEKMNICQYCLNGNWFYKIYKNTFLSKFFITKIPINLLFKLIFYLFLDLYFLKNSQFECKLYSLDEILEKSSFNTDIIDLIKIDVEKAELQVLNGIGHKTWKKIRQIAIEIHDIDNRIEKIKKILIKNKFKNITITDKAPPKFYNFIINGIKDNDDDEIVFNSQNSKNQWNDLVANIYATK